jgi:acyl carrier protein
MADKNMQFSGDLIETLTRAFPSERRAILKSCVLNVIETTLRYEPSLGEYDRPLAEMGMDSLAGAELKMQLERSLGRPLPQTLVFDNPSVNGITSYIADQVLFLDAMHQSKGNLPQDRVDAS